MINNKFILFNLETTFLQALDNNNIKPDSICFIVDKNYIYTQGTYFYGSMKNERITNLTDILEDESSEEEEP